MLLELLQEMGELMLGGIDDGLPLSFIDKPPALVLPMWLRWKPSTHATKPKPRVFRLGANVCHRRLSCLSTGTLPTAFRRHFFKVSS